MDTHTGRRKSEVNLKTSNSALTYMQDVTRQSYIIKLSEYVLLQILFVWGYVKRFMCVFLRWALFHLSNRKQIFAMHTATSNSPILFRQTRNYKIRNFSAWKSPFPLSLEATSEIVGNRLHDRSTYWINVTFPTMKQRWYYVVNSINHNSKSNRRWNIVEISRRIDEHCIDIVSTFDC